METTVVERKPISPRLRKMEIGERACFPIEQLSSVRVTTGRVQAQYRRKFQTTTDKDTICVIRIK